MAALLVVSLVSGLLNEFECLFQPVPNSLIY